MPRQIRQSDSSKPRRPAATTPEARESQLVALAVDLAEQQLAAGTASVAVITHYLKLGSMRESLEREKLISENELRKAQVESARSAKNVEELYAKAIESMREYSGSADDSDTYEAI